MSWLDQIKTRLIITTPDSREYKPDWINAKKKVDFNIAKFEFPNVRGSLVYRGEPKGTEYVVELYFQGEDHLQLAKNFQTSANDRRAWKIQHPFYGQLKVQPISLDFDNTDLNISKITGVIIETISQDYPAGKVSSTDYITEKGIAASQMFSTSAANNTIITKVPPANISAKGIAKLKGQLTAFKNTVAKIVKHTTSDFQKYFNAFNKAYSSLNNLISQASSVLNFTQVVIMQPALFSQSIKSRFTMLENQFNVLRSNIVGLSNLDKLMYSTNQGSNISAFCLAAANPMPEDYAYATDTYNTIEQLLGFYNQYLADLDFLQTDNGGSTDSFIPDADSLMLLAELMNFTLSNLFNIAVNGQQQRSIIAEADTNWIILAHRLYGIDQNDENLIKLMTQNNAGLNSILQVKKNTKIIYYI